MIEWIVSSSALILMLALLRQLFYKRLSMRVCYGLWLAVAVRLLVPVTFFESSISVLNLVRLPEVSGGVKEETETGEGWQGEKRDVGQAEPGPYGMRDIFSVTAAAGEGDAGAKTPEVGGRQGTVGESAGVAVGNAGLAVGNAGVAVGSAGLTVGNTGMDVGNAGLAVGNAGMAVGNAGLINGNAGLASGNAGMAVGNAGLINGNAGLASGNAGMAVGNAGLRNGKESLLQGKNSDKSGRDEKIPSEPGTASIGAGAGSGAGAAKMAAVLRCIWLCGAVGCALAAAMINFNYQRNIYLSRRCFQDCGESRLPVYVSAAVRTPCMFGVLHPAVYLSTDDVEEKALRYILCHENTHYRHRDNLWALVRVACLCIHWYNPLVWLAATLSRQDCELACDEETIRRLGRGERIDYGRVLLEFSVQGGTALGGLRLSTTMSGKKKQLRERLLMITRTPQNHVAALAVVLLAAPLMFTAAFTRSRAEERQTGGDIPAGAFFRESQESAKENLKMKSTKEPLRGEAPDADEEKAYIVSADGLEHVSVTVSQGDGGKYTLQVVSEPIPEGGAYHILRIDLYRGEGGEVLQSVCPDKVKPLYTRAVSQEASGEQESRLSYQMDGKLSFAKPLQNFDDLPLYAVSRFLSADNGPILSDSPDGGIVVVDLNFDGCLDFCIQAGTGSANIPYYCYLWNPEEGRYEHGAMIPNVQVDEEAELVVSPAEEGEGIRSVKYYRFDEENRLHMVRYVEENSSPDALFPVWDLNYCRAEAYGVEAVDDLASAVNYGGELNERLVYWAKQALTELYEWSGTKMNKAYFTTSAFGDFFFGQSEQDVRASRTFYTRCYGAKAGFSDCIESITVATERVVWYSTVTQWNAPEGIKDMTDAQVVEWYFGRLPLTEGEISAGMEESGENSYVIEAESGKYYEIEFNRASREVSSIYGPYSVYPEH